MRKEKKIVESVENALKNISGQPKDVLCEVYWTLNSFKWHERLGRKPEGFDDLPCYNIKLFDKVLKKETRFDYVDRIMKSIALAVPIKTRYRYAHVIMKKDMTEKEFEDWYDSERDNLF